MYHTDGRQHDSKEKHTLTIKDKETMMAGYLKQTEQQRKYLTDTRRHLHRHPELSMKEHETADLIRSELTGSGVPWKKIGQTGTLGWIDTGKPGKIIVLRADIDALPMEEKTDVPWRSVNSGVMHACGHDIHTASLLGTAKILSGMKEKLSGRVMFVFQQAEEFGHGSRFFIEDGTVAQADIAMGCHISPGLECGKAALSKGTDAASCAYFRIVFKGRSAHVSKPQEGADALRAAAQLVMQLPVIKSSIDPMERAILEVGHLESGSTFNIIAAEAKLEGSMRCLSDETHRQLQEKVKASAETIAALNGCEAEIYFETFASALVNDDDVRLGAAAAAGLTLGEENVIPDGEVLFGFAADDFSDLAKGAASAYIHIGTADPARPETSLPLHSDGLDVDEEALLVAADIFVRYVLAELAE